MLYLCLDKHEKLELVHSRLTVFVPTVITLCGLEESEVQVVVGKKGLHILRQVTQKYIAYL